MKIRCLFGKHDWSGCTCRICGAQRHEFEETGREFFEGDGCKWSVSDPCIGPYCGTPCDSYYPGREGKYNITKTCKYCGMTETTEVSAHEADGGWHP